MTETCTALWGIVGSEVVYRCQKPVDHPPGRHIYNGNGWHVYWFGKRDGLHVAEPPLEQEASYD